MARTISAAEAARRYGVNERTIRTWIKDGLLRAGVARVAGPLQHAIDVEELEKLLIARHLFPLVSGERTTSDEIEELKSRIEEMSTRLAIIEGLLTVDTPKKTPSDAPPDKKAIDPVIVPLMDTHAPAPSQGQKMGYPTDGVLPDELIPFDRIIHGIPASTARYWRDQQLRIEGQTWIVRGHWRDRNSSHLISFAITPEGQYQYHNWARAKGDTKICEYCLACAKRAF